MNRLEVGGDKNHFVFSHRRLPFNVEWASGFEPESLARQASTLPLSYARIAWLGRSDSNGDKVRQRHLAYHWPTTDRIWLRRGILTPICTFRACGPYS